MKDFLLHPGELGTKQCFRTILEPTLKRPAQLNIGRQARGEAERFGELEHESVDQRFLPVRRVIVVSNDDFPVTDDTRPTSAHT